MIEHADEFIPAFAEAGASWISVHAGSVRHLHRTLQLIECVAASRLWSFNPATPVHTLDESWIWYITFW